MNDEQKQKLKNDLINLMESVGNGTPPKLPRKSFLLKLYVRKFLRWLASPITYFVQKRKIKRIKLEMLQAAADIRAAQIHTLQKGLEFLDSLPAIKNRK